MSPSWSESSPIEQLVLPSLRDLSRGFEVLRALPSATRKMVGPFVFLDHFGPMVFGPDNAPGVAAHPHIGLSTLTYLLEGEMHHRDSVGSVQTIRAGDVNWMTAGKGIVHSERTPPRPAGSRLALFGQQIWVALPKSSEEAEPAFAHFAEQALPTVCDADVVMTVVAGQAFGKTSPVPVFSDLMYVDVVLRKGARLQVPKEHIERAAFLISGDVVVEGQDSIFRPEQLIVFRPGVEVVLRARSDAHLMLLGGEPLAEPRHAYWNFVSSSRERIEQAKADWREGRFPAIAGETEFLALPPEPSRRA